jgi:hypothetical protein
VNSFPRQAGVLRWPDLQELVLASLDSFSEEYLHTALFRSVQFSWIFWFLVCKWNHCCGSPSALTIFNMKYVRGVLWLSDQIEKGSFLRPFGGNFCLVAWGHILQTG